jgi:hypothetical protein
VSSPSTASTSTAPTVSSFDDLSDLGEYILDLLGRDRRSEDLLVHWVAHRLAEHMQRAERARTKREREGARDAAALLITRLWETRAGWSTGWPPGGTKLLDQALGRSDPWGEAMNDEPLPPWLSSLRTLDELHRREQRVWIHAAFFELDMVAVRRALEAAPERLDDSEDLQSLRKQLAVADEAAAWIAPLADEGEDPSRRADRAAILERVLAGIADERKTLVEQALKDTRRNQKRKPAVPSSPSVRGRRHR